MELKRFILATAGHVDHGKSALVRALTGTHPDRLPEEKLRGITIELGFAQLELRMPDTLLSIGIVDVPGHEDFVKNMVAASARSILRCSSSRLMTVGCRRRKNICRF